VTVPVERVRAVNGAPVRPERAFVLYWMTAARRVRWSHALDHALALARQLSRPLVIYEPLRLGYPHASDRLHAFLLAGMAENQRRLAGKPVHYLPWVERAPGQGEGLLAALGRAACAVVADDFPGQFPARLVAEAGGLLDVRLEAVDGSGLYPFRLAGRDFLTAYLFRRHLQRHLPAWLDRLPAAEPLSRLRLPRLEGLPRALTRRWPAATPAELSRPAALAAALPIDHAVAPAGAGGAAAAEARLATFLEHGLAHYSEARDEPDLDGASGLSPWLHFGHLSAQEVAAQVLRREGWTPMLLAPRVDGRREGWWGVSPPAEAFLDQLVTWRELGLNWAAHRPDHLALSSLPAWARATLGRHAADPRVPCYDLQAFQEARTHDPLWNAAQRQLLREGLIHNTLRMLWGKKILEWSASTEAALEIMLALNDRYALDGRDPNSHTGIFWVLGRHDRPWAPERPILGTVRYMSSANQARKHAVKGYLARFGPAPEAGSGDQLALPRMEADGAKPEAGGAKTAAGRAKPRTASQAERG
jgi:deoxyribodipyrimidine photo-lyase